MTDTLLISDALNVIRPGAEYTVRADGDSYTLDWQDETAQPTPAEIDAAIGEAKWNRARRRRDLLLSGCDWTAVSDNQLTDAERDAWQTYRQALRDITTQADPDAVTWPVEPTP